MDRILNKLRFDSKGLIPCVIQDAGKGEVLTLCYMNREAIKKTLTTRKVHVFRRSKGKLMMKGETSGCIQHVKEIFADCEENSLLIKVKQIGFACHKGKKTCFFRKITDKSQKRIK